MAHFPQLPQLPLDLYRAHTVSPFLHPVHPSHPIHPDPHSNSNPDHATAYGIIDELTTSLWDLKDGSDGYSGKPPYPYLTLIRIALLSSESKKLTLQELYDTLEQRYPFFKGEAKGWKNSIRHNLSLNRCFKKESRHVLDPGKGSYWYVDLNEEHSTPRIRNRRKTNDSHGAMSPKGKKRKLSPAFPPELSPERDIKPRMSDLRLPPTSLTIPPRRASTRVRAISAPSPLTPSFFAGFQNVAGHPQPFAPSLQQQQHQQHQQQHQDPFGLHLEQNTHHLQQNTHHPLNGYAYSAPLQQQQQQQQTYAYPPIVGGQPIDFQPYVTSMPCTLLPSSASSASGASNGSDPTERRNSVHAGHEVNPDNAPSSSGSTSDSSAYNHPETPRTDFAHMTIKSVLAVNGAAPSPPPGPSNAYSFPAHGSSSAPPSVSSVEAISAPSVQQRHIPPMPMPLSRPTGYAHAHEYPHASAQLSDHYNFHRPIPPPLLVSGGTRTWSPLPSTATATSPTRLLPSNDYDKLFSTAPFGMLFSDAPRKQSRSNSIFGVVTR